jgi:hypothetical protein
VDFFLLALCDRLVIESSSSFAHLAALLAPAAPGAVVDVHPLRAILRGHRTRLYRVYWRFVSRPRSRLRAWLHSRQSQGPGW